MPNLEGQSIWVRKDLWPRGDIEHVFLADAFNRVGRAIFPSQWVGNEPSLVGPRGKPLDEGASEDDVASVVRAVRVAEWITDQGRYGHLVTEGQSLNGGGYFTWNKSIWDKEPDWSDRFRRCRTGELGRESHLFFASQSFELALIGVHVEEAPASCVEPAPFQVPSKLSDVWLSPYMQLMIETIRHLGIDEQNMPKKEEVKHAMRELASRFGLDFGPARPSNKQDNGMLERLASAVRSVESQKGRAK